MTTVQEFLIEQKRWEELRGLPDKTVLSFILEYGKQFGVPDPPTRRPLRNQRCYENCRRLAFRKGFTYVEGYAAGVIPMHHAWCLDKHAKVIDPTWGPELSVDYFGIPFKTDFLRRYAKEFPSALSLIDNWQDGWPLVKGKYPVDVFLETGE